MLDSTQYLVDQIPPELKNNNPVDNSSLILTLASRGCQKGNYALNALLQPLLPSITARLKANDPDLQFETKVTYLKAICNYIHSTHTTEADKDNRLSAMNFLAEYIKELKASPSQNRGPDYKLLSIAYSTLCNIAEIPDNIFIDHEHFNSSINSVLFYFQKNIDCERCISDFLNAKYEDRCGEHFKQANEYSRKHK